MSVPNNLRAIREKKDWTLEVAAEKAGISDGYLSKIENGKRDLNARTMKKLMKGYGVTAEEIVAQGGPTRSSIAEVVERIRPERRSGVLALLEIIASWEGDYDPDAPIIDNRHLRTEDKGAAKRAKSYRREAIRKNE